MDPQSPPAPLNSFKILRALKTCIPESLVITGRTNLPVLTIPQTTAYGVPLGPIKVFYNLAPKQFRIVDDMHPKYEHRCGAAFEVLEELENLLDADFPEPPEEIQQLC